MDYDVLVIGGGPAGTSCAISLGKAGKKVGLIEKDAIGGVCLNRGCIPSKTYLYALEIFETIQKAKRYGIKISEPKVMWSEVKKRKDANVKMLGLGLAQNLANAKVEVIAAEAKITGPNVVTVKMAGADANRANGEKTLTTEKIVIASGSESLFLPTIVKGSNVLSTTEILDLEDLPKSLVIIGGGVTGVEMASLFAGFAARVHILERAPAILPTQDREAAAELKKALEKKGCTILNEVEVTSCNDDGAGVKTIYKTKEGVQDTIESDKALVVIGRIINNDFLKALTQIGIRNDGRRIELNEFLQTSIPSIYVIGDSAFRNLTAYGGEREGECVATHIVGPTSSGTLPKTVNYSHIPTTVFSHPELGAIGMTEEEAKTKGISYEIKKNSYGFNAKALILGAREGFMKMVIEKETQKILGVHIVGVSASDLVHQAIFAVMKGVTVPEWREIIFSHPVLSEVLKL